MCIRRKASMEGLATEDPAKNTTEDPAKNTTKDQAASSSTRVVPKAKAAPTPAQLDEWENRPSEQKRRLMLGARSIMQGNARVLGVEHF